MHNGITLLRGNGDVTYRAPIGTTTHVHQANRAPSVVTGNCMSVYVSVFVQPRYTAFKVCVIFQLQGFMKLYCVLVYPYCGVYAKKMCVVVFV